MSDYHKDKIKEQGKQIAMLEAELARVKGALNEVRLDLLRRGKKDSQGVIVVELGSSAWIQLEDALNNKGEGKG